jgi:hypothetical protein
MLKFGKIRRGSAIMSRIIKAELKRSNQYSDFIRLIMRIRKNGMTSVQLSKLTPLMLQSLVSFCSMSKEIQKEGLDSLALALALKKRQIVTGTGYNCRRLCVKSILLFQNAKRSSKNYYFAFGKEVVVIAA